MVEFSFIFSPRFIALNVQLLLYVSVGSSYAGGQWAAGDEPLYYIVSPKDVVIAKPR